MAQYSLNEVLKARAAELEPPKEDGEIHLDDMTRVKVLSPGRKVFKRFKKNRLAMFGAYLLIFMFLFSFIGPLFYAYSQTRIFYKKQVTNGEYAVVKQTTAYNDIKLNNEIEIEERVDLMMNSNIKKMLENNAEKMAVIGEEKQYVITKVSDEIFTLSEAEMTRICKTGIIEMQVGVFDNTGAGSLELSVEEEIPGLDAALRDNIKRESSGSFEFNGATYTFVKLEGKRYSISRIEEGIEYDGAPLNEAFESAMTKSVTDGSWSFSAGGKDYAAAPDENNPDVFYVYEIRNPKVTDAYSTLSVHLVTLGSASASAVRYEAIEALVREETRFDVDNHFTVERLEDAAPATDEDGQPLQEAEARYRVTDALGNEVMINELGYSVKETPDGPVLVDEDGNEIHGEIRSYTISQTEDGYEFFDDSGELFGIMNDWRLTRYSGEDSLTFELKSILETQAKSQAASGTKSATVTGPVPAQDDKGARVYDEEGNIVYNDTELLLTRQATGEYVVRCDQVFHLIDRYAPPSGSHILGTDGDGFDVFARIMYGGRVSLLVSFVTVFLEIILGVIMGGLAGYYGKWVDMLVMRLVDIFYCLPSMPILIIIGAAMDGMRTDPIIRLIVMIAALGIMGWAGVARMVRGQILSLREQEFMVAAEATGIKVRSRIFRHLIPNVMPQLIVIATMSMGGTILTESTLSYLGLGVKHPLATWGSMINSVSTATAMKYYAYIWIPVGLLICLTVIAFNFVGDGLRDAYDPKSSR